MIDVPNIFLPHPNPPRCIGEGTNFSGFPHFQGGIKGGNLICLYTQVIPTERFAIESLLFLKLPHPNPPLIKGRELIFPVSPQYIGGIKGGNLTFVYTVVVKGKELIFPVSPIYKGGLRGVKNHATQAIKQPLRRN